MRPGGNNYGLIEERPYGLNRPWPQAARKLHILKVVRLLCLVGLAALLDRCCQTAKVEGRWQCGGLVISVYADGVASFSGMKATWSPIGPEAIRLEFSEKGETGVAEITVAGKSENGLRAATFNQGSLKINCSEVPREGSK